jgi:hypothetical protein
VLGPFDGGLGVAGLRHQRAVPISDDTLSSMLRWISVSEGYRRAVAKEVEVRARDKGRPQHGYQLPLTPAQHYKAGCAGMTAACQARFGKPFDKLAAAEREAFLLDIAGGKVRAGAVDLGGWFNSLVYPLFTRARLPTRSTAATRARRRGSSSATPAFRRCMRRTWCAIAASRTHFPPSRSRSRT